ncbi:MAG: AI-2E family transporter [Pseudomonadota bacterium]
MDGTSRDDERSSRPAGDAARRLSDTDGGQAGLGAEKAVILALPRLTSLTLALAAGLWLLIELRPVLQPLVLSALIWFLLAAVARLIARLAHGPAAQPGRVALAASATVFAAGFTLLSLLLADSAADFRDSLPAYRENLRAMVAPVADMLGLNLPRIGEMIRGLDANALALNVLGSVVGSLGQAVVIAVLVFFLFAEARRFPDKLNALLGDSARREQASAMLAQISRMIERYLGMKCLIGLIQALPTWAILSAVGVDSPLVWAVFVFFLSFIPTIGSLVGIALPSLLALVQFESPTPFLVTIALLTPLQILASNWLEPRLMGDSLNLSPLAIFLSIFGGGMVWGVTGALISVPALTVIAIAMAQGERTRPVAILLSRDGQLLS